MLGFVGSGVTGFIVLILYTQKLIIGVITYIMVFAMAIVLAFGFWIVNSTYYTQIITMQGQNCFLTWDISKFSDFDVSSQWSWRDWFGFPDSGNAGALCTISLTTIQFWCIVR